MKKQLIISAILFSLVYIPFHLAAQKPSSMSAVCGTPTAQRPNGRFEVFAGISGNKGGVYHTWQLADGSGWQPSWTIYSPAPDDNPHGLVAGKDGNGRMVVAWITNGNIYVAEARYKDASLLHSPEPTFRPAGEADGHVYNFRYLTIANNPDGMIEILALNDRGRVYSIKELTQDESKSYWTWQKPTLIGGGNLQNISVTRINDRLALIGTGKDGKVWLKNQTVAGIWDNDPWTDLGGNQIKEAYTQESKDHQLEVVALGTDESLYLRFQNVGSNTWRGWEMLLSSQRVGRLAPAVFFGRFKDGSLFVASHKDAGSTQYVGTFGKAFQSANNGAWSGIFYAYQAPANPTDYLDFLSPAAFAVAADVTGVIHYFSCYRSAPRVEHYIDYAGASEIRSLAYEHHEHEMPDFVW